MKHPVDPSKEVQSIKTKLIRRFKFIFLLWSLLFPICALLVFSVCIFTVSCKFIPRVSEQEMCR